MNIVSLFLNKLPLQALFSAVLICYFTLITSTVNSAELENTAFLPVKVISLSQKDSLEPLADQALFSSLADHGITPVSRSQAEQLLNYQGNWPPSASVLSRLAEIQNSAFVVTGNLTELGGQLSLDLKVFDILSPGDSKYFSAQSSDTGSLAQLFSELINKVSSFIDKDEVIASIAPAGNSKIDSGAILKNILTKPGDPYNPSNLRKDLRSIFDMGYFDDVQIEVSQEDDGRAVLFRVVEKPVIAAIIYTGNDELDEEKIQEVVTIKEQSVLNPAQINRDSEAIQLLYKSKGYYNTVVTTQINFPQQGEAEIRFVIEEGKKIYIKAITFEGNSAFDDDDLEDEIETNTKGLFSWLTNSGLLDYDKLNQDASRILNFYGNHGFLEAKISDPVVSQEKEWLYINFVIEEGTRFKIGTIDLQGDLLEDKENIISTLESPEQEYVSRKILRDDILKITDYYAEKGYANANIRPIISKPKDAKDTIDITITIEKGDLVYINRINIVGNNRTRDNVIRRDLKVEEGEIFNAKALRESVQKLQYLDFFEEVNITPEPSFDQNTVDLNVEVKDKSTGQFTIGAGYSSVDNLIFMGEIAENNFLGRGDTLALSANVGGESNRYNLKYKDPRFRDSQLSWGMDLYDQEREYDDYTRDSIGGAVSFGYPLWEKWRGYGSYSYTDTDLSDIDEDASYIIRNSADIHVTSAVKFTVQRDTRNRRFGATKGTRHSLSVRYAGGILAGDAEFTKVEGSTSWYFPLFWDTVFHFHGAAGQVFENEDDALPVYERFYLGGLRSIRGFDYGKISPKDPETGERIGGDKMWYTNFEYIFPLLAEQGLNGVAFFDMGYVFDDDEDWGFDELKKSAGVGIRWNSPMGPLRLEWGYNLDPEDDEDESVWDFSVGGVF